MMNNDYSAFTSDMMDKYLQRTMSLGIFAMPHDNINGTKPYYFYDNELVERDRKTFAKYTPVIKALNRAGWEPITILSNGFEKNVYIERFGKAGKELYFTVYNDSNSKKEFALPFYIGTLRMIGFTDANITLDDYRLVDRLDNSAVPIKLSEKISLEPYQCRVFKLVTLEGTKYLGFDDTKNHWASEGISIAVGCGYMVGASETRFVPDTPITLGMFVTILGRLAKADVNAYDDFRVNEGEQKYYDPYFGWAMNKKLFDNLAIDIKAPNIFLSRQDTAALLCSYANALGHTIPIALDAEVFNDKDTISDYAKSSVERLQRAGVINGKPGNVFDPQGKITRAEICTLLYRYMSIVMD